MGMYNLKAHNRWAKDVLKMIADDPTTVSRTRESTPDKFKGSKVITTAGPFTVRIEPFRQIRGEENIDQEGSQALSNFTMLCVDLAVDTFKEGDTVTDGVYKYRVSTSNLDGRVLEVALQKQQ